MSDPTLGIAARVAVGFVAGFIVAVPHFASLSWNTRLFTTGSAGKAIALQLGRITVVVVVLTLLARLSLVTLLSGALGFLAARPSLIWRFGELR